MLKTLALIGAGAAVAVGVGLALPANAVTLQSSSMTTKALTNELTAIDKSPAYQCYLQAEAYTNPNGSESVPLLPGASSQSWSNGAAADWTYVRTTQLAKVSFVGAHDPQAFSKESLLEAEASLKNQVAQTVYSAVTASNSTYNCKAVSLNGTSSAAAYATTVMTTAFETLPTWFVNEQVKAQAATLGLESLLPDAIPESGPGLEAWYAANAGDFDTTCISIVSVSSVAEAEAVQAKIKDGMTITEAFHKYDAGILTTKGKDGADGCYAPGSAFYSGVIRPDINSLPIGRVSIFSVSGGYALVGPTKRTPNGFSTIAVAVADEAHSENEEAAALLAVKVQRAASVTVDPAIGTWAPTALGGTIEPPLAPPPASVLNVAANTPPAPATSTPTQ